MDIQWCKYIDLYIYTYPRYKYVTTYSHIYIYIPSPPLRIHLSDPGIGSRDLGCCGTSGNSLCAVTWWPDRRMFRWINLLLMEAMEKMGKNKNCWKRRQSRLLFFFLGGGGEFDNQDFPLSSLDYPTCVSKHKMHFPFRIEDKKWQCVISIGPSKLEFHTYTFACMCVTYIHIIDACIYLRVDTHRETERLHVLTLVLTPNIGVGQPHLARFDCLAVGRAKSCSNLVVRRHVFVERSVGYYVKNVGLFLLHSSFGIWEVINIKVFGEVHQIQFR